MRSLLQRNKITKRKHLSLTCTTGRVMVLIESYSFPEDKGESDDSFITDDVSENVNITDGVPKIGMEFDSEQQAYDYNNRYARSVGFSISRSSSTHRKDKTISRRVLQCSNAGMYKKHPRGSPVKPRLHSRTGCQAKLVVKLQSDNIKYSIEEFVEDHNH
ncbi:hypothetical protein MKW98_008459 [Papaver atlanticum]|uniref:FAR1 domain-containing protein n=1 Tax=Papaver atlanticum TaxID=357466 RepID=A0AAD4SHL5_9MAGN|nr:hypothetical protein MKW98_008459 [Papaver atlanticum]